jgi:hypothetical protein
MMFSELLARSLMDSRIHWKEQVEYTYSILQAHLVSVFNDVICGSIEWISLSKIAYGNKDY